MSWRNSACVLAVVVGLVGPSVSSAHIAPTGEWAATYRHLQRLFPKADPDSWRILRYQISEDNAQRLERDLGFEPTPHDRRPTFYVARDERGEFLGVAMFVTPHIEAAAADGHRHDGHAHFEVGVAVAPDGSLAALHPYEVGEATALRAPAFLEQFQGRTLASSFQIGEDLDAAAGFPLSSQHVADAARESLLTMQLALGAERSAE